MTTTYDPVTDDGVTYCRNCYCACNMHDEHSMRCPQPEDDRWEQAMVREYEMYGRYAA